MVSIVECATLTVDLSIIRIGQAIGTTMWFSDGRRSFSNLEVRPTLECSFATTASIYTETVECC